MEINIIKPLQHQKEIEIPKKPKYPIYKMSQEEKSRLRQITITFMLPKIFTRWRD